ncbi:hypothetical protein CHCC14596_0094 [Bacillus licheniformis]|nr:hypothetical protein CHCC14596_0094 [Bacillus licheniformis]
MLTRAPFLLVDYSIETFPLVIEMSILFFSFPFFPVSVRFSLATWSNE